MNLPKMRDGGLDVSFMIAYVGQGPLTDEGYANAYRQVVAKFDAAHRLAEQIAPKDIGLALTPDDVLRIVKSGRSVAVIGIENGYPIGTDIRRVREFYDAVGAACRWRTTGTTSCPTRTPARTRRTRRIAASARAGVR